MRTARTSTLVVTSPVEDDGKSTVAINLAAALALAGRRVVLVDADVRFSPDAATGDEDVPGLLDVLEGRAPLSPALQPTLLPELTLLGVGHTRPGVAPHVVGDRWAETSGLLADVAEVVVVEAAPVLTSADAVRVGQHGALVVVCVQEARSTRPALDRAVQEFERSGARVLGCILVESRRWWRFGRRSAAAVNSRVAAPEVRLSQQLVTPHTEPDLRPHTEYAPEDASRTPVPYQNGHRPLDQDALRRTTDRYDNGLS